MSIARRLVYMGIGAFLVLAVVIGAAVTFAQDDDDAGEITPDVPAEEDNTESTVPDFGPHDFRGTRDDEYLADALGISVEELEAAYEVAWTDAIEQAVDEGLITAAQAETLLENAGHFHGKFGLGLAASSDQNTLLAEALGISVDELQAARVEAYQARLQAMVDAGYLTQEEADLRAAQQAVQFYVDQDALTAALQDAYETAIDSALGAGAIDEAQAEQLRENMPSFDRFRLPGGLGDGFGRPHGRGHHGGPGMMPGDGFFNNNSVAPAIGASTNA